MKPAPTMMIVQIARYPKIAEPDRLGALIPVNADGFYVDAAEAADVARYMADERPDLETFIVKVIDRLP